MREAGRVVGVQLEDGGGEMASAGDRGGRPRSIAARLSGLPLRELGAPMDVFWFRLPKERTPRERNDRDLQQAGGSW